MNKLELSQDESRKEGGRNCTAFAVRHLIERIAATNGIAAGAFVQFITVLPMKKTK
jgi:hypothetical protein